MDLYLDLETYFDRKTGYDLKSISATEYIRDPRFQIQGCGVSEDQKPPFWLKPNQLKTYLAGLDSQNVRLMNHNSKFDASILAWKLNFIPAQYIDTLSMANAVLGTTVSSCSLATLAKHYGLPEKGFLNTDGKRELTAGEEAELASYCLHDVELLVEIYKRLEKDFPKSQYPIMDWTIRTFVQPKLILDVPLLEKASKEEAARRDSFFQKPGYEKERFSSNQKFAELLESEGYTVPRKVSPRTGKEIPALALGDVDFLEMLEGDDEHLRELCEARRAAKSTLLETRTGILARLGKTGPWPFDVIFSGAKQTHRFSGGNAGGGNPQNFKRDSALREGVTVPKGFSLIDADFSKAEPAIVATLAGQDDLRDALARNEDVYSDFASEYYGHKVNKQTNYEEYMFGKECIIAPMYMMGAEKFQYRVRIKLKKYISIDEAQRAIDINRSKYWKIPKYWNYLQDIIPQMSDGGFGELMGLPAIKIEGSNFILPSGLPIRYPSLRLEWIVNKKTGKKRQQWVYDAYRKAKTSELVMIYSGKMLENIAQALVGEICKEAIVRINERYFLSGQNHDEILGVVKEEETNEAIPWIKSEMEKSPSWWPKLKVNVEINAGKNWLDAK